MQTATAWIWSIKSEFLLISCSCQSVWQISWCRKLSVCVKQIFAVGSRVSSLISLLTASAMYTVSLSALISLRSWGAHSTTLTALSLNTSRFSLYEVKTLHSQFLLSQQCWVSGSITYSSDILFMWMPQQTWWTTDKKQNKLIITDCMQCVSFYFLSHSQSCEAITITAIFFWRTAVSWTAISASQSACVSNSLPIWTVSIRAYWELYAVSQTLHSVFNCPAVYAQSIPCHQHLHAVLLSANLWSGAQILTQVKASTAHLQNSCTDQLSNNEKWAHHTWWDLCNWPLCS